MIDIITQAAQSGGEVLLKYFGKKITVSEKTSHQNLVTEADYASQKTIVDFITQSLIQKGIGESEIGFIGEEGLYKKGMHLFIIDPLDGTNNFASGNTYFGVSIGYYKDGIAQAAAIYNPIEQIFYYAEKDKGAFKQQNNEKIKLKIESKPLKNSLLIINYSSNPQVRARVLDAVAKIMGKLRGLRMYGACTLDLCGMTDAGIGVTAYGKSSLWDLAGADLILRESGGMIYDWNGNPLLLELDKPDLTYPVIACHPDMIREIVQDINT